MRRLQDDDRTNNQPTDYDMDDGFERVTAAAIIPDAIAWIIAALTVTAMLGLVVWSVFAFWMNV